MFLTLWPSGFRATGPKSSEGYEFDPFQADAHPLGVKGKGFFK